MPPNDYQTWTNKIKGMSLGTLPGTPMPSANSVRCIHFEDGDNVLFKIISPERPYIARIKILGEAAFSLFDYHLNQVGRVTPNVLPMSTFSLCRQFIPGLRGDLWREKIHGEQRNLEKVDRIIIDQISSSVSAHRIALLDFIFLCQDRSAANWIKAESGHFSAIDNNMLWPYRGRFADKRTVKTGKVDHLRPPMNALIPAGLIKFRNGIFSAIHAGGKVNGELLARLGLIEWEKYFIELRELIEPLGYPPDFIKDWRFQRIQDRARWIVNNGRLPSVIEANQSEWQDMIGLPQSSTQSIWKLKWEM